MKILKTIGYIILLIYAVLTPFFWVVLILLLLWIIYWCLINKLPENNILKRFSYWLANSEEDDNEIKVTKEDEQKKE